MHRRDSILLMSFLLSTLIAIIIALGLGSGTASAATSGDYQYSLINGGMSVEITGYTGSNSTVVIPEELESLPVTSIGNNAFNGQSSLVSVTIPDNVTCIGDRAFYACYNINAIEMPDKATRIGNESFSICSSLNSVIIPQNVTYIGYQSFQACESITSITIPDSVTYVGYMAFGQCTSLKSLTISNNLSFIGVSTFADCYDLTTVVIPDNVSEISQYAFFSCRSLASIHIGNGTYSIGGYAFSACSSLVSIEVDQNNSHLAVVDGVLYYKNMITLIQYPGGRSGAFTVPDGVTTIASGAFSLNSGLTSLTMPVSLTDIGGGNFGAFYSCNNLARIIFKGSAPSVEGTNWAELCSQLAVYYYPDRAGFSTPTWNGVPAFPIPAPSAPQNLAAVVGAAQVTLSWTMPTGEQISPIDYYIVYRDGVDVQHAIALGCIITSLTNGHNYSFQVAAHNGAGVGCNSSTTYATPITVPGAPIGTIPLALNSHIMLFWAAPIDDGGSAIDYYLIYQDGIDVQHVSALNCTIQSLTNGHNYTFLVAAHNAAGVGPNSSEVWSIPYTLSSAPTDLLATSSDAQVTLSWSAPISDGGYAIDYYVIYQNATDVQHVTGMTCTIAGLTNGCIYYFIVAAHTHVGIGVITSAVACTPLIIPGVPTDLVATPGDGQVSLSWDAPLYSSSLAIDYYIIYQDGVDVHHAFALSHIILGLVNGHEYSFKVAAHNAVGIGIQTDAVSCTPFTLPGAPTSLIATPGDAQVVLTWDAPSSNGGAAIDYYIIYQDGTDVLHLTSFLVTMTGLTNGHIYSFNVAAHNALGIGANTSIVNVMPVASITGPGVPTGLTATAGDGQVSLSWTAPTSNGGAVIDFYIVYQDGVDVQHVLSTAVTIVGLTNDHEYSFKVAAHNSVGTGTYSSAVTTTPVVSISVPGAPVGLTTLVGDAEVYLSWSAPSSNGGATIDYYIVYQNDVEVKHVTSTSTTISDLSNGHGYSFRIAAHNSAGIGPLCSSNTCIPCTIPGAPTDLNGLPSNGQTVLSWNAPSSNGGAPIVNYLIYQNGENAGSTTGTSLTITGLTNGQTYLFTVKAVNLVGAGLASEPISVTPTVAPISSPPGPVTALSMVRNVDNGSITFNWAAPSTGGAATKIQIFRSTTDLKPTIPIRNLSGTTTQYTDEDVESGTTYYYWVVANNSYGSGDASASGAVSLGSSNISQGIDSLLINVTIGLIIAIVALVTGFLVIKKRRKMPPNN